MTDNAATTNGRRSISWKAAASAFASIVVVLGGIAFKDLRDSLAEVKEEVKQISLRQAAARGERTVQIDNIHRRLEILEKDHHDGRETNRRVQ